MPGLDLAWEKVKETIIRIVSRYQNRRLQLAQDNADENKDSFEFFAEPHKKLWAETKSLLKDDVTAVMNPAKLVLDAQFNMMLQELIDGIMTILPIEPAQRVDGAALRGIIGNLLDVARSHAGEVSDELHDFEACPDRDKDGQRLLVLSKVRDLGDAEKQHYFVSRDGVLGRLYSSDHRFEEAGADDPGAAEFRKVLTTDSLQRPLSEFRADSPVVHRVTGGDARIARIGDVIGEIDLATAVFTPTGPDTRRYEPAVWKTRSIRAWKGVGGEAEKGKASAAAKKGYWQLRNGKPVGELVEGTWHQPFDTPHILIFEPLLGRREWVRAEWETGDPGITVGDALAKLGTALPRYNRL